MLVSLMLGPCTGLPHRAYFGILLRFARHRCIFVSPSRTCPAPGITLEDLRAFAHVLAFSMSRLRHLAGVLYLHDGRVYCDWDQERARRRVGLLMTA